MSNAKRTIIGLAIVGFLVVFLSLVFNGFFFPQKENKETVLKIETQEFIIEIQGETARVTFQEEIRQNDDDFSRALSTALLTVMKTHRVTRISPNLYGEKENKPKVLYLTVKTRQSP